LVPRSLPHQLKTFFKAFDWWKMQASDWWKINNTNFLVKIIIFNQMKQTKLSQFIEHPKSSDAEAEINFENVCTDQTDNLKPQDGQTKKGEALENGFWVVPDDPESHLIKTMERNGLIMNPKSFYAKPLFVWNPAVQFQNLEILCPRCYGGTSPKGWVSDARLIYGLQENYWLHSRRYICNTENCRYHFVASSPDCLALLPKFVQDKFPAVLSKRAGMDKTVLQLVESLSDTPVGPTYVQKMLTEFHTLQYDRKKRNYFAIAAYIREKWESQGKILVNVNLFGKFNDPAAYGGRVPSQQYIMKMLNREIDRKRSYFDYEVQRRGLKVASIDHSYKVSKHLGQLNGMKLFEGLFTCKNEYGEIRLQQLVQSSSMEELTLSFENCFANLKANNMALPEIVYDDKCCEHGNFLKRVWPSLAVRPGEGMEFEMLEVPTVVYMKTNFDVMMHLTPIMTQIQNLQGTAMKLNVGLDCEWNIRMQKGQNPKLGKVGTIQMAFSSIQENVYVFQTNQVDKLPIVLESILIHERVNLIGVRVTQDIQHIISDFGIEREQVKSSVVELNDLVSIRRPYMQIRKNCSLDNLCQVFLMKALQKDTKSIEKIRKHTDWNSVLHKEELDYAARDAIASLLVFEVLSNDNIEIPVVSKIKFKKVSNRILLDVFHAMNRLLKNIPTKHPFLYCFSQLLREAFFQYYEDDISRVKEALTLQNPGVDADVLFKEKMIGDIDWVLKRVRRRLYQPDVLEKNLNCLKEEFSKEQYNDLNGVPLLNDKTKAQFQHLLKHVRNGCLSDPEGVDLYMPISKDSLGLIEYRCIRGTSDVESLHQKLEMNFAPWNAGPEYADNNLAVKRHRFNIRASERYRKGFPKVGHYDHYILDETYRYMKTIFEKLNCIHDWWDPESFNLLDGPSKCFRFTESFGILPAIEKSKQVAVSQEMVADYPSSVGFLAIKMNTMIPQLPIRTKQEMKLYKLLFPKFGINANPNGTNVNWQEFADFWNLGAFGEDYKPRVLKNVNDCIFEKLPCHLSGYYLKYKRALIRDALTLATKNARNTNTGLKSFANYNLKQHVTLTQQGWTDQLLDDSDIDSSDDELPFEMGPQLLLSESFLAASKMEIVLPEKTKFVQDASALTVTKKRTLHHEQQSTQKKKKSPKTCKKCKSQSCPGRGTGTCNTCTECLSFSCLGNRKLTIATRTGNSRDCSSRIGIQTMVIYRAKAPLACYIQTDVNCYRVAVLQLLYAMFQRQSNNF
jgi:hypothetical protein